MCRARRPGPPLPGVDRRLEFVALRVQVIHSPLPLYLPPQCSRGETGFSPSPAAPAPVTLEPSALLHGSEARNAAPRLARVDDPRHGHAGGPATGLQPRRG